MRSSDWVLGWLGPPGTCLDPEHGTAVPVWNQLRRCHTHCRVTCSRVHATHRHRTCCSRCGGGQLSQAFSDRLHRASTWPTAATLLQQLHQPLEPARPGRKRARSCWTGMKLEWGTACRGCRLDAGHRSALPTGGGGGGGGGSLRAVMGLARPAETARSRWTTHLQPPGLHSTAAADCELLGNAVPDAHCSQDWLKS